MAVFFKVLIKFLNSKVINQALRSFCKSKLSRFLIKPYAKHYKINLDEVEKEQKDFLSLNEFFIRKLKPGARPIADQDLVSPVDGKVLFIETIDEEARFKVKDERLSLSELLGKEGSKYIGGKFLLIYLSPANYHRIHAPADLEVEDLCKYKNKSWPVNDKGLSLRPDLLCTNLRYVYELSANTAMIMVGATNVNSIVEYQKRKWTKGEELGYFQFGSTIILLFAKDTVKLKLQINQEIKQGQALGKYL